jgi:hypothetical protein
LQEFDFSKTYLFFHEKVRFASTANAIVQL